MRFFVKRIIPLLVILALCSCAFPSLASAEEQIVYLGGTPLAISVKTEGLTVLGLCEVQSDQGLSSPAKDGGVRVGDRLLAMDGVAVNCREDVQRALDLASGKPVNMSLERDGRSVYAWVTPLWDQSTDGYRLGMYLKDSIDGIGTLTYVASGRFGALGHCVSEGDDSDPTPISGGEIYATTVTGAIIGKKGEAGSLLGGKRGDKPLGTITSNTVFGIYGDAAPALSAGRRRVTVAEPKEVKEGKAYIYTTVTQGEPRLYEVQLTEVYRQRRPQIKGMMLKVTDPDLLALTGGIVQGMSGSPILQDGKLVGAVTHVVVSDPTVGYGVYARFMLDQG